MPKSIKLVGTRPGTMYGLCKKYIQEVDCCPFLPLAPSPLPHPSFRPILLALQTSTCNLAKLRQVFSQRLIHFAEEICEQDPSLSMDNLDVDSLFTNNPFDETIDVCINQLFENNDNRLRFHKVRT